MGTETPRPGSARAGLPPHRWERVASTGEVAVVAAQTTVIAGGGPAGLTAAYELSKHGHKCVVLEADPLRVGGISRTEQYKGYRFDIGGHRFFSKSPEVNHLWTELLGDEFLRRSRLSRIYYDRKFFHYPLRPLDALAKLGPVRSAAHPGQLRRRPGCGRSGRSGASRTGWSTGSAGSSSRSSSRPTPRRSGGCRPRRSPPTGPPSGSRD